MLKRSQDLSNSILNRITDYRVIDVKVKNVVSTIARMRIHLYI